MKRIVIVGMGFGGLRVAQALAGSGVEVVVLDRENYHLFQPLLYQVATAALEEESIAYPIRAITRRWRNVHFRLSEVCGVDLQSRILHTADTDISYDCLVIAAGSVTNFFGNESIAQNAFDLKQLDHAVELRNQILSSFEQAAKEQDPAKRRALLSFVIVGGGPTGVEFAGALAELVRFVLTKDYPGLPLADTRILLIEAGDRLLPALPPKLGSYAVRRLQRLGVELQFGTAVTGAGPEKIFLNNGSIIGTHTIFWSAGVSAAPLASAIPVPKAHAGRIVVLPDLTLPGHPEVYVIGDIAYCEQEGKGLPMVAPVAMQQGRYVGRAILKRMKGETVPPFRYRDKGTMATIGRNSAVASFGRLRASGFIAWLVWLGLHLFYLIGFRNRLLVLLNWAFYYLFKERQVRLITRESQGGSCK